MNASPKQLQEALSDLEILPPRLRKLVEVVGVAATCKLVEHKGGTRIYVPRNFMPDHWLAKLIGHQAAATLVTALPGIMLEIDKARAPMRELRNRTIRREADDGVAATVQAGRYDLTERQVWTIRAGGDTLDDKQSPLFT